MKIIIVGGGETGAAQTDQTAGADGVLLLRLNNEDVGGERHDLEEDKGGEQVSGQEHTHGRAQRQHPEDVHHTAEQVYP